MPIAFHPVTRQFFLHAGASTYAMGVADLGAIAHLYWGPRLEAHDLSYVIPIMGRAFSPNPAGAPRDFSLDNLPQEFPVYGNSDFRSPAIEASDPATGSRILDLRYRTHRIEAGKPAIKGLPATFATEHEADTLVLVLADDVSGVHVELSYTAFRDHPVIARSARIVNHGHGPVILRRALSASLDLPAGRGKFHLLHLSGNWIREREVVCAPLRPGAQSIESRRGSSSHHHNPFIALTEHGEHEEHGETLGFNLVYSGNFLASVEVDSDGSPRVQMGINPFDFTWELEPGAAFHTPEAILAHSTAGLGGLSRSYHRFYRKHLGAGKWHRLGRPILINNFEATEFDFDAAQLEKIAAAGAALGMELFVLDDGWFGRRDDACSSLGDWVAHERKLPGGLKDLATRIEAHGMKFGLWFEPEMVSPDSDLYRAHPDWCLHVPGRPRSLGRDQAVLDFSREEVRDAVFDSLARILHAVPVTFVKWDMNRNMTEIGSLALPRTRQAETAHRYMLGVYAVLDRVIREFPDILIEGCSGGGGRFDPGMLHYMPQIWTSDNSDAISRLRIQHGTSIVYPLSTISAHVSAIPNLQVGRVTPMRTRGHVALTGAFGYELDLTKLSNTDREEVRAQITACRRFGRLLMDGDLYRLRSPLAGNESAWMVVAPDGSEALITHVQILAQPNPGVRFLALRGLDASRRYRVESTGQMFPGDALMRIGVEIPKPKQDFESHQWHVVAC